ncbi:c-type cytochrome [Haloferula sargassicola]
MVFVLAACDQMREDPAKRTYDTSSFFDDGKVARNPPAGTLTRDSTDELTSRDAAGQLLSTLPMPIDRALLDRGHERYQIFCAVCHGDDGYGDGIVPQRGFPSPPSFHTDRLRGAPVGYFHEVITQGYGVMFSYASRVPSRDRWAIAAYIRALQLSQHTPLSSLDEETRNALPDG